MDNLQKTALLRDADNTQIGEIELVIREVSTHGRIVVKRAYGNWKKDNLKNWENELKRLAIKAIQQFDYVVGKNATDIALVIDTIDLLHSGIYDAFVIVASDSDYTPLAIKLHESGVYVIGVGEKKTKNAFRNACDEFILLENLTSSSNEKPTESDVNNFEKSTEFDVDNVKESTEPNFDNIDEIHELLKIAFNTYQDDNGFVNVSSAGTYIKRTKPDFDVRTFGFTKLPEMLAAYPEKYEIKKYKGKGPVNIIAYKCLEKR